MGEKRQASLNGQQRIVEEVDENANIKDKRH